MTNLPSLSTDRPLGALRTFLVEPMTPLPPQRLRAAALHIGVWLGYVALAVLLTWPLAQHLQDHVLDAPYSWDALTNTMILGTRVQNVLGAFQDGYGAGGAYDAYFFAPIPQTIAFNENLFGLSLLFAPIYLISHEPILSYNLVLLWSLSLSGYFTFLLVRRLTESQLKVANREAVFAASFLAGAAFAFCPYVVFEIGRIQLVATQWLPLCLLMLHRALSGRRWVDFVGLALVFAMQVGTCLYYALFLLPIMVVVSLVVVVRERAWSLRLLSQLAVAGGLAAALIVPMIAPYFGVRQHFDLTRDEDYAQSFDGKLSFLANVHTDNRIWLPLRHRFVGAGAHEEIAFPGLTIALLALLALALPAFTALASCAPDVRRRLLVSLVFVLSTGVVASFGATAATGTMLGAVVVVIAALAHWRSLARDVQLLPETTSLYALAVLLSVGLFLGIEPLKVNGEPVHGLYYYLFTYVPGFDGIRKVSRQAIVVMLTLSVLGGLGAAVLLARLRNVRVRVAAGLVLATLVVVETYSVPMRLASVPAGNAVPDVYHFIARKKEPGPIAVIPARDGRRFYRGHPGQALHNYLSLYHRHRTINGKSSWIPPVTRLFDDYMNRFPNPTATQLLLALGTRQLVVHAGDYGPERATRVIDYLSADTQHYELLARSGSDSVYRMRTASEDEGWLLPLPKLPAGAVTVNPAKLSASAQLNPKRVRDAIDGSPSTLWSSLRPQRGSDWFEVRVADESPIVAIDIEPGERVLEVPLSFEVSVADVGAVTQPSRVILSRPRIFFYADQVYSPKKFVWRVLLPAPTRVSRIRITVREPLANQPWAIPELRLWALPRAAQP